MTKMGLFSNAKDSWAFASEKPSSKDFGKSKADWKASKDAQKDASGKGGKGK
jgi:hypothetical protein